MQPLFNQTIKTPTLGAQTNIACAVDEKFGSQSGLYYRYMTNRHSRSILYTNVLPRFSDCQAETPSQRAQNMDDAEKLWNISLEKVGLGNFAEY